MLIGANDELHAAWGVARTHRGSRVVNASGIGGDGDRSRSDDVRVSQTGGLEIHEVTLTVPGLGDRKIQPCVLAVVVLSECALAKETSGQQRKNGIRNFHFIWDFVAGEVLPSRLLYRYGDGLAGGCNQDILNGVLGPPFDLWRIAWMRFSDAPLSVPASRALLWKPRNYLRV